MISIANAPCSWGVLEFDPRMTRAAADGPPFARVLDEMNAAGYAGTELGPFGYMPTDADALQRQLARRRLGLAGAFVPARLADQTAHGRVLGDALIRARLLADACPTDLGLPDPVLVLSDDNAANADRVRHAGRITPEQGLTAEAWATFAAGVNLVARSIRVARGLRTAFHHHCAGYVETAEEIAALLDRTDPDLVGLCLDTGHACYAGADPAALLDRYGDRIWHVHLKDCDPLVAARAREKGWDYFTALREGVFCELGAGDVDLRGVVDRLRARGYDGWIVVEQDIVAGRGTPLDSARRSREFLRSIGL